MLLDPHRLTQAARAVRTSGAAAAREAAATGWRTRLRQLATEETATAAGRRALVVVAHGIDLTAGVGALVARKRAAGTHVEAIIVGDSRHQHPSRYLTPSALAALAEAETVEAAAMLGLDREQLTFLGFEHGRLPALVPQITAAVADRLAALATFDVATLDVATFDVDDIFLPTVDDGDLDRTAVHHAVVAAAARSGSAARLLAVPVERWRAGPNPVGGVRPGPGFDLRSLATGEVPPLRQVATDRFEFLKRAAFDLHRSFRENLTGEVDWQVLPTDWLEPLAAPSEVFVEISRAGAAQSLLAAAATPATANRSSGEGTTRPVPLPLRDRFLDDRLPGAVVGSTGVPTAGASTPGPLRSGVDVEGSISIHHGEARLGPIAEPGFGRQGLAYGPVERRAGRTLVVVLRHSHQNAHVDLARQGRREMLTRAVRTLPRPRLLPPVPAENLVVGFAPDHVVADPAAGGHLFSVAPAGWINGELGVRLDGGRAVFRRGVQELPLALVIRLGEHGARFYAASVPDTPGFAGAPRLRPVAATRHGDADLLYGGIWQSVHGEAGHQLASHVSAVDIVDVEDWADPTCDALLDETLAGGANSDEGEVVTRTLSEPAGLVAVTIVTGPRFVAGGHLEVVVRASADGRTGWRIRLDPDGARLDRLDPSIGTDVATGERGARTVATSPRSLVAAAHAALQILDDGHELHIALDGEPLFGSPAAADRDDAEQRTIVLVRSSGVDATFETVEAHPRVIDAPPELDLTPFWDERGEQDAWRECFAGPAGELGATVLDSGRSWRRVLGTGSFDVLGPLRGPGLVVRADRHHPNPDRTVYATAWHDPDFADVSVGILPPGRARSQGEGCRGGLCFFQDADNYAVLNLWIDDSPNHNGSAVSMFVRMRGHERDIDAPWTNIGRRATWGRPVRLRASSDGDRVMVWLDDEPVLFRRLRDIIPTAPKLQLTHVGIVANREWGDDTGSVFTELVARQRVSSTFRPHHDLELEG